MNSKSNRSNWRPVIWNVERVVFFASDFLLLLCKKSFVGGASKETRASKRLNILYVFFKQL